MPSKKTRPIPRPKFDVEKIVVPQGRCGGRRGKYGYATEEIALEALDHAKQTRAKKRSAVVEKRAYQCPRCKLWHLTSQEKPNGDR